MMQSTERRIDELVVVDPTLEDYEPLIRQLAHCGARVHLFSTGEEALRAAPARAASLWMINVRLPDMPGIGLLTLLRGRQRSVCVFLVGDAYSADEELAARAAGATAYVCKPPAMGWLEVFPLRCEDHAIRAGPPPCIGRKC